MNGHKLLRLLWVYPSLIVILFAGALGMAPPPDASAPIHFAVIGDYGEAGSDELDVADLVKGWDPDFIITTGDNNYPDGSAATIDQNIGQYYHEFIFPYTGSYGAGAATNRFFPSLGNHDWVTPNAQPYLDYFTLPGNERYYDFVRGPVHFFVLDSDSHEPDGNTSTSTQAVWLQNALAASTSPWNLVYLHHAPYSSAQHGSNTTLQWPYAAWGADAVLAGHDHTYERIFRDGIVYFVNGLGGRSIYSFGAPVAGSQFRYNEDYGAMLVDATETQITFKFINRAGEVIDTYYLGTVQPPSIPVLTSPANNALVTDYTPLLNWNDSSPDLDHYQLQLDDNSDFGSPLIDEAGILVSDFTPLTDLAPNAKYYWRVRAFNVVGGASAWSPSRYFRTAILPPTLALPADNDFLLNKRPTFSWNSVPGAASYVLEVSTSEFFTSRVVNKTVPTLTCAHTADLLPDTHYFWRVKANPAAGNYGPSGYSDVREFTTANPPGIPLLTAPANNVLTTDYTPALDWKDVTLPAGTTFGHYEVQIDNHSDFSSPEATGSTTSGDIADSDFTPVSDLASNTRFYWRVRSVNSDGEYSAWSLSRTFRTALTPPVLNAPADAADLLELRPPFDWSDVPGAAGYTIQIANNQNFSPILRTANTTASNYTPTAGLTRNATLYWRVQTRGANGPSAWPEVVRSFHTPVNPPGMPTLTAPANNFLTTNYTPAFAWSMPPASPPFDHFIIQIDNNSDFSSPEVNETGVAAAPFTPASDLASNTKFYWRVRAVNLAGEMGNWSAVRTLRTALTPPALTAPANGSVTSDTTPAFTWNAVPGAASYTLQVSKNDTFTQLVLNKTVAAASYTPAAALPANIPLYWRVRANGANGPSSWSSPTWSFTIQ